MEALLITMGVIGGLVVGVVAAVSVLRRDTSKRNAADVDELAIEVARIARLVRKTHMSNVRGAMPREEQPILTSPAAHKAALRNRVFGGTQRGGNGST